MKTALYLTNEIYDFIFLQQGGVGNGKEIAKLVNIFS